MSARSTRQIEKALLAKGFSRIHGKHKRYLLLVKGKKTAMFTKLSHGAKEYGEGLVGAMSRQLGLTRKEFDDFVECPLTAELYLDLMISRKRIVP